MKKRADGRYAKSIVIKGKKQFFYGKTQAEVNKKILDYKTKEENGKTFREVAELWWDEHSPTLAYSSIRYYQAPYKNAVDEFGDDFIIDIKPMDINQYLKKLAVKKYSHKSVFARLMVVRQIIDFAVLNGLVNYNVASVVKIPKNLSRTEREPADEETIAKIKNSFGNTFSLFALVALYTGCRRGEILALTSDDIDYTQKTININKSVYHVNNQPFVKAPKTKTSIRVIPLLAPLEECLLSSKIKGYLFNIDGKMLTDKQARSLWDKYCKETNIKITPHQLRHAFATRLYELDIDEKSAQDLLGHSDIQTTKNVYTHITNQKRKITADKLQSF